MSTTQLWLYEHEDGRHLAAPAGAAILAGDPQWHRVGPVEVQGVAPVAEALHNADKFQAFCAAYPMRSVQDPEADAFYAGVAFAEKAHGITPKGSV